ncbi:hypothetical protein DB347_20995 [Opitutaceae bacterium EW11]|nr:hypothetical protein DB347_20995 [Opitutaceae bacterium EW11]
MLAASSLSATSLKLEDWTDTQGGKFRGDPAEVLGPLALFRTSQTTGRHLAFHFLSAEDCVRFYERAKEAPARADDWSQAKSSVSAELKGRVSRLVDGKLVSAELKGREPEFYVVFYASSGAGDSWGMLGNAGEPYKKLKSVVPEEFEAVFFGIRHDVIAQTNMAKTMNVPWLVCDLRDEDLITSLSRFVPNEGFSMVIVTRTGVPLLAAAQPDANKVKEMFAGLAGFLDALRPENPQTWQDRQHYLKAVQAVSHPQGYTGPVLVGNPLRADGLVQRKVFRFNASIKVAADGSVTEVTMQPDELLPEKMSAPIAGALKKAMFVPAVQDGKYVDSEYTYHFEAPK